MAATIEAAGVVLVRRTKSDGVRVCVIHRPRHKDWSLPKGKRDDGEMLATTAWRETREETYLDVSLGPPLSQQRYRVDGRPKTVDYWVGHVAGDLRRFKPNNEVDALLWLPVAKAKAKLSYDRDRDLVDEAVELPPTSPLIVLRHTDAVKRSDFKGSRDSRRPLSKEGRIDARKLVPVLRSFGVREVHSSDSRRCIDTVVPLSRSLGSKVIEEPLFSEESFERQSKVTLARLARLARRPRGVVICTHRPVLPDVINALSQRFNLRAKQGRLLDPALSTGGFIVLHRELDAKGRVTGRCVAVERYDG